MEKSNPFEELPYGYLNGVVNVHCVTPGLTVGYNTATRFSDIPESSHHLLHLVIRTCGENQNLTHFVSNETECIKWMEELMPSAIRERTPTSAGMAGLSTPHRNFSEGLLNRMWDKLYIMMRIRKDDAIQARRYLLCHLKEIAEENLMGQCTDGHSCKQRSQHQLRRLIRKQEGGNNTMFIFNDEFRNMCKDQL